MTESALKQGVMFESDGYRRVEEGERAYVWLGSKMVLTYLTTDEAEVRLAIATLRSANLRGKAIAKVLGVAESSVSRVMKRIAGRGLAEAVAGRRRGKVATITPKVGRRVQELAEQGLGHREIAAKLGISTGSVSKAANLDLPRRKAEQLSLTESGTCAPEDPTLPQAPMPPEAPEETRRVSCNSAERPDAEDELLPCEPLPSGPAEHPSRYAGMVLLGGGLLATGIVDALKDAGATRTVEKGYTEAEVVLALSMAWASGYASLEAMHERDARALGAALGLERSPCVRTLHRAIAEMARGLDPVALNASLLRALEDEDDDDESVRVYGIDGHFKAYSGTEPIDKGWDSKKRIARKGLQDVYVTALDGRMVLREDVLAGDGLEKHVVRVARRIRDGVGTGAPLTFAFDRGGFAFEVLNELQSEGLRYITYVTASVKTPDLSDIAPADDGFGELAPWKHSRLDHAARLIVARDGDALIPVVTNLPNDVDSARVVGLLRSARSMQENGFKAAREFMNIDALNDRGGARRAPDDRDVPNPALLELASKRDAAQERYRKLALDHPAGGQVNDLAASQQLVANLEEALFEHAMQGTPAKVHKLELDPHAQRAWLKTCNRSLLLAIKLAADNARRRLLRTLGSALAPTDQAYDQSARNRTLVQLLRAPGTLRFDDACVHVTLECLLPPEPHARLAEAIKRLDSLDLRCVDGRPIRARLAPRTTRATLPHWAADSVGRIPVP